MTTPLHTSHDPLIVLLSIVVAIMASYVSLDIAERLRGARLDRVDQRRNGGRLRGVAEIA